MKHHNKFSEYPSPHANKKLNRKEPFIVMTAFRSYSLNNFHIQHTAVANCTYHVLHYILVFILLLEVCTFDHLHLIPTPQIPCLW